MDGRGNAMTYNTSSTSGLCLTEGVLFALKYKRPTTGQHRGYHRSQGLTWPRTEDYASAPTDLTPSPDLSGCLGDDRIPDEDNLDLCLDRGNHSIYSKQCDPPVSLSARLKRWKKYNISPDRYCNPVSVKSNSFGVLVDYCGDDIYIAEKPDRACTNLCAYDDSAASLKYVNNFHSRMYHLCSRRRVNMLKNIGCFPCYSTCPTYTTRTCGPPHCLAPPLCNLGTRFKSVPQPPEVKPVIIRESLKPYIPPPPQAHPAQPRPSTKSSSTATEPPPPEVNSVSFRSFLQSSNTATEPPPPEVKSVSFRSFLQSSSETNMPTPPQVKPVGPRSPFPPRDGVSILSPPHVRRARDSVTMLSPPEVIRARDSVTVLSPPEVRRARHSDTILSPPEVGPARSGFNVSSPPEVMPTRNSVNISSPPQVMPASVRASVQSSMNYPYYHKRLSLFARRQLSSQSSSVASAEDMYDYDEDGTSASTVEENKPIVVENNKTGTKITLQTREISTITTPEKEQRSTQTWEERHKKSTQTSLERNELLKKLPYISSAFDLSIRRHELFDKWRSVFIPRRRIESSHSDISVQSKGAKPPFTHTAIRQKNRNNAQTPHLKKVSFEDKFVNTDIVVPKKETTDKATSPKPLTHDKATSVDLRMLDKSTLTDMPMADTASNTDAAPLESERKKRSAGSDLNYFELVTPSVCCPTRCKWDRYADDVFCCKTDCRVNARCVPPPYAPDPCANRHTPSCTTVCLDPPACAPPRSHFESPPSLRQCVKATTSSCRNLYLKCKVGAQRMTSQ
ncbi:unnamed protein product [Lymnaea stagnalis]|uniref:Uncharacterized protein n=1 Tax=Lymnaea stagnalis TaxID=6523 RepID=A0AAV2IM59_LYMST